MKQVWRVERDRIAGIPIYLVRLQDEKPRPVVLVMHGLGHDKEQLLHPALALASLGYAAVLPDAIHHGERRPADFEDRAANQFLSFLMECVCGTADEIPALLDAIQARSDIAPGPAAMTGFSMGGYVTFRAFCIEPRLVAVAPCGSSGYWAYGYDATIRENPWIAEIVRSIDPASHVAEFPPRALLIQNGALDTVVPVEQSRQLYQLARPAYEECPERLRYVEYPDLGHEFSDAMQQEICNWLQRWLPVEG